MASAELLSDPAHLFQQLDNYDWDNDAEFQGGLRAILASADSPEKATHLTLRARCYYFARKFNAPVDFEGYLHWVKHGSGHGGNVAQPAPQDTAPSVSELSTDSQHSAQAGTPMGDAPPPASFAEICELIAEGKPIPGIKDIPDTILEGQRSESHAAQRKKPWEKDAAPAATPSWAQRQ